MTMQLDQSTEAQKAFHKDMRDVVTKHMAALPPLDMLGVTSHLVGMILTLQDPKHITVPQAMLIVEFNINKGNEDTLAMLDAMPINQPAQGEA